MSDSVFNKKPNYNHIVVKDCDAQITLTEEEAKAVLWAYDRGMDRVDEDAKHQLDLVILKLKDQIWP